MWKFLILTLMVSGPVWGADWKMRAGDKVFGGDALKARLSGQTLVFYDNGRSVYKADGSYSYTYGGGGTWEGRWETQDESAVCVTFVTGVTRCDRIVENAGKLVVLTDKGERFPVKP
ncbi:hypothetical protein SAMN05444000_101226 [Shimia gijangensis]|uniref:Uncharacterized protein n=1 Tax=Shimia gijangensis TaxID=1470563 RepID=A0A1M6BGP1_9RHOB|nr:hypothetical protein [Shimia gijangensis]SHI47875.1 hypothetical protein SAMN05444000_101226 [Shimia gijangensis]